MAGNTQNENAVNLNSLLEIFSNFVRFYKGVYSETKADHKTTENTLLLLNKLLGYGLGSTEKKAAAGQEPRVEAQQ